MSFSKIPATYASIRKPLIYEFEAGKLVASIELRIIHNQQTLGRCIFRKTDRCTCDISPYLDQIAPPCPSPRTTGFYPADEFQIGIEVEAHIRPLATSVDPKPEPIINHAPKRIFLWGNASLHDCLLSSLPSSRLIAQGEYEQLLFILATPQRFTLSINSAPQPEKVDLGIAPKGLVQFILAADDFPKAESITLCWNDRPTCSFLRIHRPQGSVRVAWLSEAGSIEQYTFPTVAKRTLQIQKTRIHTPNNIRLRSSATQLTTLRSAYETDDWIEAIADIARSESVWRILPEREPQPLLVHTNQLTTHRHGTLSCIELDVSSAQNPDSQWN